MASPSEPASPQPHHGEALRILVVGRRGLLAQALAAHDCEAVTIHAIGRPQLDILDEATVTRAFEAVQPHAVINAAAYTAVDEAEVQVEQAYALNRDGAEFLAEAAAERGVALVHVSSDYVFDGRKGAPYVEDDATGPLNVYGQSKRAGEIAVMRAHPQAVIARPAWLMGRWRRCFPSIMVELAQRHDVIDVVADQLGSPTIADDVAAALIVVAQARIAGRGQPGPLHLAGPKAATWRDIAAVVFDEARRCGAPDARVRAVTTREFGSPALRPADSRLDSTLAKRLYGITLPSWETGARTCVRAAVAAPVNAEPLHTPAGADPTPRS